MAKNSNEGEVFQTSPLMVLLSYTILCCGIIAETIMMSWELWVIPVMLVGVLVSWGLHLTQFMSVRARIWIYTLLMMTSFFFYGIHVSSTYDMGFLMVLIIMIFTTTGEIALIYVCQVTYYATLLYDIIIMCLMDTDWDRLMVTRTALHVGLMFLAGWLARTIIRRWSLIFGKTGNRIAELNESTNRMNSFMANLSHELRTPINAILGITNVMLDKEDDRELKTNMNEILKAGNRMADQVGDILDYSEIEMDSLVVNSSNYMIASVLNDLVTELRPIIPENLELVIDVDAEIPSILKGDPVKLRRILYHTINNGLKYTKDGGVYVKLSCIKQEYGINLCLEITDTGVGMTKDELDRIYNRFYQAKSGREVRSGGLGISMVIVSGFVKALGGFMTVYSEKDAGTTVRVSIPQEVVDDGRCMMVADESKIALGAFLDMAKYPNPNVREFYNKMILSIVRGLKTTMHRVDNVDDLKKLLERVNLTHLFVADVEYDGNREYLESLADRMKVVIVAKESYELPYGSRAQIMQKPFYCIPVVAVLNSDKDKAQEPERRMRCNGVRALVVDDEPMNLNVAKGIFRRYGMEVSTANSGEEAIAMCRNKDYDLIFMDHMMPGMDGVEAMKRIRYEAGKNRRDFSIIALTANALSTAREMFIAEGFDGFVSKPVELIELERVLKKVLPKGLISYEYISAEGTVIEERKKQVQKQEVKPAEEKPADNAGDPDEILTGAGIDIKKGVEYCAGDRDFYDQVLAEYAGEAEEKKRKLDKFLEDKDMKNYAILVHSLKSTSLMIGAEALSAKAKALELAAKEERIDFVEKNHGEAVDEYEKVADAVNRALGTVSGPETAEESTSEEDDEVLEFYPE